MSLPLLPSPPQPATPTKSYAQAVMNSKDATPLQDEGTLLAGSVAVRVLSSPVGNPHTPESIKKDIREMTFVLLDAIKTVTPNHPITPEVERSMQEMARKHILRHANDNVLPTSLLSPK